jgi:hypothetical protein
MLRTRLYLGLLPLLLLLIAMGGYAVRTCQELSRSLELTMVANYRAMLATEVMKNAATSMNGALYQAQSGDPAATGQFDAQRALFARNLHEQSMTAAGTPSTIPSWPRRRRMRSFSRWARSPARRWTARPRRPASPR